MNRFERSWSLFKSSLLVIIRNKLALCDIARETYSSTNFADSDSLWDRGSIENRIAL